MYHTSPSKIEKITKNGGCAGSCLFFSDEEYFMSSSSKYVYEAELSYIEASDLYDEEIINHIASVYDLDLEVAESLLDSSENEWDVIENCEGEDSWFIQQMRAECAKKMGYDACKDEDEQGVVYIADMKNKECKLNLIRIEE